MARRILLLLLATLALSGWAYTLRNKRPEKRPVAAITTNIPALQLDGPPAEQPSSHRPSVEFSPATIATSRMALLIVIGVVLAAGAHFGLGKGSHTARAAVMDDPAPAHQSLDTRLTYSMQRSVMPDEARALLSTSASQLLPPAAATPEAVQAPAPTPAVAAEVETPAPAPQPTPAPPPPPLPADGIEAIICALPWPCQEAIGVAACESGRDMNGRLDGAWATNGNHYGIFQISYIHAYRWPDFYENWMDPAKNAQWAYEIWSQQGWYPWSCRWAAYH